MLIKARIDRIDQMLEMYSQEKAQLQAKCPHDHVTYKYGANTGNYDPHADSYWVDLTCKDCGSRTHQDQDDWHSMRPHLYPIDGKIWGRESTEKLC